MDDDVYADFIAEVLAGGFGPAPPGQWSAEQIAAHIARTHEELIDTTETILAGDAANYDNRDAVDARQLDRYVREYRGLCGLADRIAQTSVALREFAARVDERVSVAVPVRIRDGERVVVDEPVLWGEILKTDEAVHVAGHLEQLRALRPAAS